MVILPSHGCINNTTGMVNSKYVIYHSIVVTSGTLSSFVRNIYAMSYIDIFVYPLCIYGCTCNVR